METREIDFFGRKLILIDLTKPLDLETEGYPGDPKPEREKVSGIETGFEYYVHKLGDHNFQPHADAPKHANKGKKGMEWFGMGFWMNRACMIDLSGSERVVKKDGIRFLVEILRGDLEPFKGVLAERTGLIIRTGYDRWVEANKKHKPEQLPYLTREAADFLAKFKGLKVIGIDSITIDRHGESYSHRKLGDKMVVEAVVHSYRIPEKNRGDFILQTVPIRIFGATGGPVAAMAFVGD